MRKPKGPRVQIDVNEKYITEGIRAHSSHCMIAETIRGSIPGITGVAVDIQTIRFSDLKKGLRYTYLTPRVAQEAIIDFDEGNRPAPFSFVLRGAHVTTAKHRSNRGGPPRPKRSKAQIRAQAAATAAAAAARAAIPRRAALQGKLLGEHPAQRVGGDPPPQLSMRREFGLRAFRAASLKRLATIEQVDHGK